MSETQPQGGLKHWLGFAGSGTLSFVVDAGVLKVLTVALGWPVLPSRLLSISLAMVAGWLAHRTFTFAVKDPPSLAEFLRFLSVAWSASAINYALFAAILFLRPQTDVLMALVLAGGVAMVASYLGLRFGAFRRPKA